jgi:hypothetical protein
MSEIGGTVSKWRSHDTHDPREGGGGAVVLGGNCPGGNCPDTILPFQPDMIMSIY